MTAGKSSELHAFEGRDVVGTVALLRRLLSYDPETGSFTRLVSVSSNARAGDIAGCIADQRGQQRLVISVSGKSYLAHRLAWLYVTGQWPAAEIDHRNGNALDNRWANLRELDHLSNIQNRHRATKGSVSGLLGVSFNQRTRKWRARIVVDKREKYLGEFLTPSEASACYLAAKRDLHPGWDHSASIQGATQ